MTSNHTQDWNNYWQGRAAQSTGNALLGVGIENNESLTAFWESIFDDAPKTTKLVDFACGAGSVLLHADKMGLSYLTGIDVSSNAIDVLKSKLPNVGGVVGAVDKTPFESAYFDMVVSQFGFEYAGDDKAVLSTIEEMTRILKPTGQVALIVHIAGGAIAQGCQKSLEQITLVQKSGFFKQAVKVFKLVYKRQKVALADDKELVAEKYKLNETAKPIMAWLRAAGATQNEFAQFSYYLLESTHKLLLNSQKYALVDCLSWIEGMENEVRAYEGRMSSMIKAAVSETVVSQIEEVFKSKDLSLRPPEQLHFAEKDLPAAWILRSI